MSAKRTCGQENSSDGPQNDVDDDLVNLLSQLQLPRMNPDGPPTIRILAVADIDLASAAALAEYALRENELGGGNVDLCIACGPFVRDEDLGKRYLQGKSKSRRKERASHERTREETAALEGLMSGALSQLESIVCRVVFCPHPTDPSTTLFMPEHLRLTPNSFNVHQRWLQLAPGIGCSGYGGITDDQGLSTGPDAVCVQHGPEYASVLRRLLELGPPSSPLSSAESLQSKDVLFAPRVSQAILVTQTGTEVTVTNANTDETFDWPKDLLAFLDSPKAQMQVLLDVVCGLSSCPLLDVQRGKVRLVAPGSLREHGDFALIDLALCQDSSSKPAYSSSPERQKYSWRVDRVQFRNMN